MLISVQLKMTNYIAHPFWPETNACIEIEKKSGVNRQKSEEKRIQALKAECDKQGVTYERYLEMKQLSKRPFYRSEDSRIYLPMHQISGALVQTIGGAPKALRGPFTKDNFRALVQIGHFQTEVTEATGIFSRFVKLENTNQRSWQENPYIGQYLDKGEPFLAEGDICIVNGDDKLEQTVKSLFVHTFKEIGLGASRKMGFGRGEIVEWKRS